MSRIDRFSRFFIGVAVLVLSSILSISISDVYAHEGRRERGKSWTPEGLSLKDHKKDAKTSEKIVQSKNDNEKLAHHINSHHVPRVSKEKDGDGRIQKVEKRIERLESKIVKAEQRLEKYESEDKAGKAKCLQKHIDKLKSKLERLKDWIQDHKGHSEDNEGGNDPKPTPAPTPSPDPAPAPDPAPSPDPAPDPTPAPEPTPDPEPAPDPGPAPTPDPAVSPETAAFVDALRGQGQVENFNKIFGMSVLNVGTIDPVLGGQIADLIGDPSFDQNAFLGVLPKAASLYSALQSDPEKLTAFNTRFNTRLPGEGSPSKADIGTLFNITGDPNYDQQAFLTDLTASPAPEPTPDPAPDPVNPEAAAFVDELRRQGQVDNFNLLFGKSVPVSGTIDPVLGGQIADLIGDPSFDQNAFLGVLPKAASLYSALQADPAVRNDFNLLFGATVRGSGSPDAGTIGITFNVAGDPNFNQQAFLGVLQKAAGLYRALQSDPAKLNAYNARFSTGLPPAGPPPGASLGQIFGLTGDPNFDLEAFLASL